MDQDQLKITPLSTFLSLQLWQDTYLHKENLNIEKTKSLRILLSEQG